MTANRLRLVSTVYATTVRMRQTDKIAGEITFFIETDNETQAREGALIKFRELVLAPDHWLDTVTKRIPAAEIPVEAEIIRAQDIVRPKAPGAMTTAKTLTGIARPSSMPWLKADVSPARRAGRR